MSWRDLPTGIESVDELARLLNERFADEEPRDWNAAGSRILNVGAPRDGADALSLAEANRRYLKIGWRPVIPEQQAAAAATVTPGPVGSGATVFHEITLDAGAVDTEVTYADGSDSAVLVVAITQNATGEGTASFGANFLASTSVDVSPDAGKLTTCIFGWIAGKWTLLCAPYQHS